VDILATFSGKVVLLRLLVLGQTLQVQQMLPKIPKDQATGAVLAPFGTVWGWKQTNFSTSLVNKTNQVEQVIAWTFAPYDTLIYPFF
jgi:hypothetical protein